MKTTEELNAIREEVETLNNKLKELTEEELAQVTGGVNPAYNIGAVLDSPAIQLPKLEVAIDLQAVQPAEAQAVVESVTKQIPANEAKVMECQRIEYTNKHF